MSLGEDDQTRSFVPLVKGTKVSHYVIISKIGAGGMGEVYLADDAELEREVALKFLPVHLAQDDEIAARFKREAQAAAKLNHPNIVTVYEVGAHNGRPFFAMEHVEGQSLKDAIKGGKLSTNDSVQIISQLCEALQVAHKAGIIHRDIKPHNVMLATDGRAKVLDFGLAHVAGKEKLTKTGSTLGTLGYMSPEQIQGKSVDERSDLFSLGVIFYEMITGRMPFDAEHEAAIHYNIVHEEPEPVSRYKSGISAEIQHIIDKALAKDSAHRYQHADGMLADLRRLSTRKGIEKRQKNLIWIACTLVIIVIAVLLVTRPLYNKDSEAEEDKLVVAVLPFENLGNPEEEYFADGVTDEIIGHLTKLSGLGVISRASSMQYKGTTKGLQQIGKELGADYIVDGTVLWDLNKESKKIRIRPQVVNVEEDINIWTQKFDISNEDLFEVHTSIAIEVANHLNLTLLSREREAIQQRPTSNIQAYELYLLGKYLDDRSRFDVARGDEAIKMLEKAVSLDSTFAKAYALLAQLYGYRYFNYEGNRDEYKQKSKSCAELAKKHAGETYVGHLAMGYYYYQIFRDYENALEEFETALEYAPNSGEILAALGYVQRRLGLWGEALRNIRKSTILDPLSVNKYNQLIYALEPMRRFAECLTAIDKAIELDSTQIQLHRKKAEITYELYESFDSVKNVIEQAKEAVGDENVVYLRASYYIWSDNFEAAVQLHDSVANKWGQTNSYWRSRLFYYVGDLDRARSAADSSIIEFEALLESNPDDYRRLSSFGLALAISERYKEAIDAGNRAVRLMPVSKDAYRGADGLLSLAEIYVIAGEYEKAIPLIDSLLKIPSNLTTNKLKYNPLFDSIRRHPRFKAIVEKYAQRN